MRAPVSVGAPDRSRSRAARELGPVGGNRAPLPWRDGDGEVEIAPRVALSDALLAACAGIGHGRAVVSLNLCKLPNAKPVPVDAIVLIQNQNANYDVLLFFDFVANRVIKLGSDEVLSQMLQVNIRLKDSPEKDAAIYRKHLKDIMETHVNNTMTC